MVKKILWSAHFHRKNYLDKSITEIKLINITFLNVTYFRLYIELLLTTFYLHTTLFIINVLKIICLFHLNTIANINIIYTKHNYQLSNVNNCLF